jgi:hypothetical protein
LPPEIFTSAKFFLQPASTTGPMKLGIIGSGPSSPHQANFSSLNAPTRRLTQPEREAENGQVFAES